MAAPAGASTAQQPLATAHPRRRAGAAALPRHAPRFHPDPQCDGIAALNPVVLALVFGIGFGATVGRPALAQARHRLCREAAAARPPSCCSGCR
jgi:hypothetical protein